MFVRCLGSGSVMTEQGEHFGLVWEGLIELLGIGTWDWLVCKEKSLFGATW